MSIQIQEGGSYKLVNVKGGTCIDLSGSDNSSIIGFDYHGGPNQQWHLEKFGSEWVFKSGTGQYLGFDGEACDGTPLRASSNPTAWDIWPDEEDPSTYRIFLHGTHLNWDLADHGNSSPGTPVTLWGKWSGKNQTWRFEQS